MSKGQKGFSVDEADWTQTIPIPGHYVATVVDAAIHIKSDTAYLRIEYSVLNGDDQRFRLDELLPLHAGREGSNYFRSAQGKGRVNSIMTTNGGPLRFADILDVPKALKGCRVVIAVKHKYIEGLPTPVVNGIVGPAEPEEEP
jgi:hypothetical protein